MKEEKQNPDLSETVSIPPAMSNPMPQTGKKKSIIQWIWLLIVALACYGVYHAVTFYFTPGRAVRQIYLIPNDAIYIIHSDSPVADWKKFSESEPWQCLKKSPSLAAIDQSAATLDSILHENKKLLSLVGKRDLMISAHKVRNGVWDFLFVIDLQKVSEIKILKDQIEFVYSMMDFKVTYRKYQDTDIIELMDPETRKILYTAFVENHYIASYTSKLVEASISEQNNPVIGLDPFFIEVDNLVANKGLFRIYIHYEYLPQLLEMYIGKENEYLPAISRSMTYAGLSLHVTKNKFELEGYTLLKDTVDPYISALFHSGAKEMNAHTILSGRTAFYTNISFSEPNIFLKELEKALSSNNPAYYDAYKKSYNQIESWFDISLADDFLSWMSGEFAITEMEPGLLGYDTDRILAVQANNMNLAKEKIASIERKVKRRTPLNVKAVTYKGFTINYVELKGFFSLFFGKMFDQFEKPYYTYIDDYVIFSNKPSTILSFIEDYEQGYLLKDDPGFKQVLSQVEKKSTYFIYTNTQKFFPLLQPVLHKKTWTDLNESREVAFSFPHTGFQITGDRQRIPMRMMMNYHPYEEEILTDDIDLEDSEDEIITEKEILDELQRFYIEKFQGNVYREYYPDGAIKIRCEIRAGMRHGKYHEYYDNGKLKIRGKYSKGLPKGTWKYYTIEGKFDYKEKM